jgi:tetratricopeptide (TPR) repeat protein
MPESEWCVPQVKGLTRDFGIALLDRAAEVGLLMALGRGYYRIHPALPWFFRRLFEQYYSKAHIAATRAFVKGVGDFGDYCASEYQHGNSEVIGVLAAEEVNLLRARVLARSNGWCDAVSSAMQGLSTLYQHTGRRAEWVRLVEEIVPDFVDPATERALPGKEEQWNLVTRYRVALARWERRWGDAERLQMHRVDWNRQHAAPTLAKPTEAWNTSEKNAVLVLASSLHELAEIQRELGLTGCVEGYREALSLDERIQNSQGAAVCAYNLGRAYQELNEIRDLDLAEQWYRRSFDLRSKEDPIGHAKCLGQLSSVAHERFVATREANRSPGECLGHFSKAEQYCMQALEMLPANAIRSLAPTHHQIGNIYRDAGQIEAALRHYQEALRHYEGMQDRFAAGQIRGNLARILANVGRFADAREWAQSALRDFEACENAEQEVVMALKLLEEIESALRATSPPS